MQLLRPGKITNSATTTGVAHKLKHHRRFGTRIHAVGGIDIRLAVLAHRRKKLRFLDALLKLGGFATKNGKNGILFKENYVR